MLCFMGFRASVPCRCNVGIASVEPAVFADSAADFNAVARVFVEGVAAPNGPRPGRSGPRCDGWTGLRPSLGRRPSCKLSSGQFEAGAGEAQGKRSAPSRGRGDIRLGNLPVEGLRVERAERRTGGARDGASNYFVTSMLRQRPVVQTTGCFSRIFC